MTPPLSEPINAALVQHQVSLEAGWNLSTRIAELHTWAERMVLEFKLEIGRPALRVERLRRATLGHYCPGRNSFGLLDEIAIDHAHLAAGPWWQVLGTLAHELLHSWQTRHGKSGKGNYHNRQFRRRALDYGLVINSRGHTQFLSPPTAFFDLLKRHGVDVAAEEVPKLNLTAPLKNGPGSKLKLWVCACPVRVRVAIPEFRARCVVCNTLFELQHRR